MEAYKSFAYIYDNLIKGDINYNAWSKTIKEICDNNDINYNRYLDIGCGTGNITVKIAPFFKECWGIDISEDMLYEAGEKLRQQRIKSNFVCQDMRELNLNRKFDLITCCLDATNYLCEDGDLNRYFSRVKNHLSENGLFIFDINSSYKLKTILGNNSFNYCDENVAYIWENFYEDKVCDMFLTFFVKEGDLYKRFDEEHSERAYEEEEIENALSLCGLSVIDKMDNYSFKKVSKETERITYIVKNLQKCYGGI